MVLHRSIENHKWGDNLTSSTHTGNNGDLWLVTCYQTFCSIPSFAKTLVTTLGGQWSKGIPVSSTLYIWCGLSNRLFSVSVVLRRLKYAAIVSLSIHSIQTLAMGSPLWRVSVGFLPINWLYQPWDNFLSNGIRPLSLAVFSTRCVICFLLLPYPTLAISTKKKFWKFSFLSSVQDSSHALRFQKFYLVMSFWVHHTRVQHCNFHATLHGFNSGDHLLFCP